MDGLSLQPVEGDGQAGFLSICCDFVNCAGLGSFVKRGKNAVKCFCSFILLTGRDKLAKISFRSSQVGFDAAVVQLFSLIAAHSALG